jgi:hypothetical protein
MVFLGLLDSDAEDEIGPIRKRLKMAESSPQIV